MYVCSMLLSVCAVIIIIIRRANTEDATFDQEGNVANYRGALLTTAARSISACGKQASSGTSVRTPTTSIMGMVRAMRHGKQRFPGRRRRHTPRSRSGCLSRPGRSPNHEDRARECQIISAPPRGCWSGRRQEAINSTRRRCRRRVKLGLPALA